MTKIYTQSFGAARVVTGSMHLLHINNKLVLIDAGMFQGKQEYLNYQPLGFNVADVDSLILTHGHLDHVGRIPLLYKYGFKGKVFAHPATFDIAKIVLLDSAKLQEEEYYTRYKKAQRVGKERFVRKPLYSVEEVKTIFKYMKKFKVLYNKKINLYRNVEFVLKSAGHILGSAFIEMNINNKKVIFSGDLGNKNNDILPAPKKHSNCDAMFIEATYGDRLHKSFKESKKEFKKVIFETLLSGGNVLIPSFAIERAQQILCILKEMSEEGYLAKNVKVFLDSPMAHKVTLVYKKYSYLLSKKCRKYNKHPFYFPQLRLVKTSKDSQKINKVSKGAIIIAGSGMCNGGRILHHFKHRLWNRKNSVIFVGYQAEGTLGREIIEGAKFIKIFNEDIIVRSKIYTINGFSAHADRDELLDWISSSMVKKLFIVHSENQRAVKFKEYIKQKLDINPHIVSFKEEIYL